MMRAWAFLAISVLCASAASADQAEDDYRTPRYKPGRVVGVAVTKPSERSDYDPQESCDTFVITPELATYFFNHSRVTSRRFFSHDTELSSCSAEGTIRFSNGDEATWTLLRNGRAVIGVTNGKRKGKAFFFHCNRCEDWGI